MITVNRGDTFNQPGLSADTVVNAAELHVHVRSLLSSPRRLQQQELLARHHVFGGRDPELAQLDRVVRESPRRFHFIHASSGFGKTALLANWLNTLPAGGAHVCSHFINRFADMADEEFALANLCEQLVGVHEVRDELPPSTGALRAVYHKLLREPPPDDRKLIILIDGLDEAKGWTPGPQLFPRSAGPHVHFVFSARVDDSVTRDQWLAQLGLTAAETDAIQLGRMDAVAIAALLQKSGPRAAAFATRPGFLSKLLSVSEGDPFYVSILVQNLADAPSADGGLETREDDLAEFFERWKQQLFEDADLAREEVYALLGVLSAALGPLRPQELARVSPALQKSLLIEREIGGRLRRYLTGNRDAGYALCHPRFREFLGRRAFQAEELARYRENLIEYCRRWREHRDEYALQHFAAHLAEAKRFPELYELMGREWKEARHRQTGSLRAFAGDLATALQAAWQGGSAPDVRQVLRVVSLLASIQSAIERIPPSLLEGLVRLGQVDAACDCAQLTVQPAKRSEAYAVIAAALETLAQPARAIDVHGLGLIAAERVADPDHSAETLLRHADALVKLGAVEPAARAAMLLVKAGQDAVKPATLEKLQAFFEKNGLAENAADANARLQAVRSSGSHMDFSWFKPERSEWDVALAEAETLEKEGRIEETRAALARARDFIVRVPSGYDPWKKWCDLAGRFQRLGGADDARDAALRALALTATDAARGSYGLVGLAVEIASIVPSLARAGLVDEAVAAAGQAVAQLGGGNLDAVAPLPGVLATAGRRDEALALCDRIRGFAETFGSDEHELRVRIAVAARSGGQVKRGHAILDAVMTAIEAMAEDGATARLLPLVAAARARLGSAVKPLARESALAEKLAPDPRHLALAGLIRPFAALGLVAEALRCRDRVAAYVATIGNVYGSMSKWPIGLELALGSIACGEGSWAAEHLATLTKTEVPPTGNVSLLRQRAAVQAACGQGTEARAMADELFALGLRYGSVASLGPSIRTLKNFQEEGRARDLLRSAFAALVSMPREDDPFGSAFVAIAAGAADLADDETMAGLRAMAESMTERYLRLRGWSALALADLERGKREDARASAARAWTFESVTESSGFFRLASDLPRLIDVWSRLGDTGACKRMRDWVVEHTLQNPGMEWGFSDLLPALAASASVAELEEMLALVRAATDLNDPNRSSRNQARTPRSIHLSVISQAFFRQGARERAADVAREALDVFMEITDGAVTPNVLPFLVPALENVADTDGLLRLLNMKADKRPYVREWGPMLRQLLPCLARFGFDDPQPTGLKALKGENRYYQPALVEFAEAYARRGLDERTAATLAEITTVSLRAEALFKVAQAHAGRGARDQAIATLHVLMQTLPALSTPGPWIAGVAVLAQSLEAPARLLAAFKRAFLKTLPVDFVTIDAGAFALAVETLVEVGGIPALERAGMIVAALERPAAKARGAAALLRARAGAGEAGPLLAGRVADVRRLIEPLADVTDRVAPLTLLAQACFVAGLGDQARDAHLQALDAARHLGRTEYFSTLEATADIAVAEIGAAEVLAALQDADAVWQAPLSNEKPVPKVRRKAASPRVKRE